MQASVVAAFIGKWLGANSSDLYAESQRAIPDTCKRNTMSILSTFILPKNILTALRRPSKPIEVSPLLAEVARCDVQQVFRRLETSDKGLSEDDAARRLQQHGPNVVAQEQRYRQVRLLARACANPLVILLLLLAAVSLMTGDPGGATVMLIMVILGVALRFIQELRAGNAAAKLKAMISVTATVVRDGQPRELPLGHLVPGDVVQLAAGDMIPADLRIVSCKDLFVTQSSLTGESLPVEKFDAKEDGSSKPALELKNTCFLGTSVASGAATGVIVETGFKTYLGSMAQAIVGQETPTSFDKGVTRFTWLMIRFMLVMVPLVFLINGLTKHDWMQAFFFALAVAVGLTPEMLPMIVSVCLSRGAIAMSQQEGDRQAAELDSESRRHGRALHGQDRHAHVGPGDSGAALRRRPPRG